MSKELVINREEFQKYLNNLSKITDNAILDIKDGEISCVVTSEDRSLFLWSVMKGDFDFDTTLNLPSLRKLSKALNLVGGTDIKLKLNSNNLEYKGSIKFKYHLFDEGILHKPKLTLSKIKSLAYDTEFTLTKDFLRDLLKTSSVFNKTKKLYIYTDDGELWWSLGDKTAANSDVFCVSSGPVDFELDDFILNLDNVSLLSFGDKPVVDVRVNNMGIGNFHSDSGNITLDYIVSSLTK